MKLNKEHAERPKYVFKNKIRLQNEALLATLQSMILYKKKKYCFPSQKTLVKVLKENWYMTFCRRTLNYHLAMLEKGGYIMRYKAHYKDGKTGAMVFRSTRYYILKNAERLTNTAKKVVETAKRFFRVQFFAQ